MLPGKAYLETSILRSLPFDLGRSDFVIFRDFCHRNGVSLATTRLCVDELIEYRREQVRKWINDLEHPPDWVAQLGNPISIQWLKKKDVLMQEIEDRVLGVFGSHGVEIIANVEVPQAQLLEMAVRKVSPFREKGRGYRDAIILLTILDHERNRTGRVGCLIVSQDADFNGADRTPGAAGLLLGIVGSLEDAREEVKERLDKMLQAYLEGREKALKDFLEERLADIQTFIRNNAPSPLHSLVGTPGFPAFEEVEAIIPETIKVLSVEEPFAGFPLDDAITGNVEITFAAKIRAEARVRQPSFSAEPLETVRTVEPIAQIGGSCLLSESGREIHLRDLKLKSIRWRTATDETIRAIFRQTE